ncbi:MAG TPA: V-type ATP synthase subunit K [Spirochaetia bacterium]|nr:V-type ATP synthase subunit K [Spirochaetia bacterium]
MTIADIGIVSALAFAALGSALGTGFAGMSAVGAWKKCFAENKPAPFLLLVFVGAPLTQTIYGMILMLQLQGSPAADSMKLAIGVLGGMAIGASALFQGRAGASASDAFAQTQKGFANNLSVLGIIESVAIFTLVFSFLIL